MKDVGEAGRGREKDSGEIVNEIPRERRKREATKNRSIFGVAGREKERERGERAEEGVEERSLAGSTKGVVFCTIVDTLFQKDFKKFIKTNCT